MYPLIPVWDVLMYIVLPVWVLAGFADYCCHRATHIESANGAKESALHWLMLGEVGIPVLGAVFLKIDALLLAFMIVCLVAHEITSHVDLKLAMATRQVTAFEQQVHSVLEMMPLTALLLLAILHWPQAEALFGFGPAQADFSLGLKQPPSWGALTPPLIGFLVFAIVPYAEEFVRGLRAEARLNPAKSLRSPD
ncbi:MAG: hypothetical protein WDM91_11825 [Rhizomicrobium sp.]